MTQKNKQYKLEKGLMLSGRKAVLTFMEKLDLIKNI